MKSKKLNMFMVSVLFFLLGNIASLVYVIFEKDKNRVWAYVPVLGFFVIGGCINGMILVGKDRRQLKKEFE